MTPMVFKFISFTFEPTTLQTSLNSQYAFAEILVRDSNLERFILLYFSLYYNVHILQFYISNESASYVMCRVPSQITICLDRLVCFYVQP